MSNDLNLCSFIGRLGRDPEVRFMPDGGAITNLSIACGWKTKEKEGVEWIRCVAFSKLAEICAEHLKKGSQVYVQGRMRTKKYQDKDGQDRYSTEIVMDRMQMLGSKPKTDSADDVDRETGEVKAPVAAAPAKKGAFDDFEDSIPF